VPQRLPRNPVDLRVHSLTEDSVTGPPVGIPRVYTTPFFTRTLVTALDWRITLAAGGAKYPRVEIDLDGVTFTVAEGSAAIAAAGLTFVSCSIVHPSTFYTAVEGLYKFPLPPDLYLDGNETMRFHVDGMAGGDQINEVKLTGLQWLNPKI